MIKASKVYFYIPVIKGVKIEWLDKKKYLDENIFPVWSWERRIDSSSNNIFYFLFSSQKSHPSKIIPSISLSKDF